MKKIVPIFLVLLLLVLSVLAVAQERTTVKGVVKDSDGEPLYGANVYIKALDLEAKINIGSATNPMGDYEFVVPPELVKGQTITLFATYMGYKLRAESITLQPGDITQDFILELDVLSMDEVVVTGLIDETPKKKLAFTVDKISAEDLELAPAVSAGQALKGKVAGVKVVTGGGRPGDGTSIRLRGSTGITTGSSPLIIVDGIITAASLRDIDALDIESIEVVKGAAASSLYGSRAAAGVLQIKTRRGTGLKLNQTRILIRNEYGFNQLAKTVKLSQHHYYEQTAPGQYIDKDGNALMQPGMTEEEYYEALRLRVTEEDEIIDNEYAKVYDNFKLIFDPGHFNRNTASISHNMRNTNFRASFSNMSESGIIPALKGYNRKNARINLDHTIQEGLSLQLGGYFSNSWRDREGGVNPFYGLMFQPVNEDLNKNNFDGTKYMVRVDPFIGEENPLYAFNNIEYEDKRLRMMGSVSMRYVPTYWFNVEGNFAYDRSDRHSDRYIPKGYKHIDAFGLELGRYTKYSYIDEAVNSSITASFNKAFGDLVTKAKLRYLYESSHYETFNARGDDLAVADVRDMGVVQGEKYIGSAMQDVRSLGYYFIGGADYKDKYIVDFLIRRDGSSLFGEDERWKTYFRVAGAYRMTLESWWPLGTDVINEFKPRYSYGTAGGRPGFSAQYETYSVSGGIVRPVNLGNKSLKPQHSIEQEMGLDVAFLDRFSFELTYANTVTEDQILQVPLAAYYGFGNQYQNAGSLESKTWESSLNAVIVSERDFSWSARVLFDRTRQTITELNRPAWKGGPENMFYYRKGETFGRIYGDKFMKSLDELKTFDGGIHAASTGNFQVNDDGYLVAVGEYNYTDGISEELWGTSVTVDDETYKWGMPIRYVDGEGTNWWPIGTVIPDYSLALSTNVRWKGITAYVLFDAQIGGDIYNETRQWSYRELNHGDCDQFGKEEGNKKPGSYYAAMYNVNANCNWYVDDGTFWKLREVNVRYTFNQAQMNRVFGGILGRTFNRISLGIIGRNLFTWTKYPGWDPDVGQDDATLFRIDNFAYPHYRTFTGFLEFEF